MRSLVRCEPFADVRWNLSAHVGQLVSDDPKQET